jgi:RHS repeat-associated protein
MYDMATYAYDNDTNTSETVCDYRARYYDPNIGRFISEVPLGSLISNPK